jgi:hypothetical protein
MPSTQNPNESETFSVVPAFQWDNPADAAILEHLARTRGEEYARLATLPDDEYLREVSLLMELNQNIPND